MLLSQAQLLAAKACNKANHSPAQTGLHIAPDGTCTATDGHKLVQVIPGARKASDYPAGDFPEIPPAGIILPARDCESARKAIPRKVGGLDILKHACIASINGAVTITTTDLATVQKIESTPIDFPFPNVAAVMPKTDPVFKIEFDAELLGSVLNLIASMDVNDGNRVRLEFHGRERPVMLLATTTAGDRVRALVMPLRPVKS